MRAFFCSSSSIYIYREREREVHASSKRPNKKRGRRRLCRFSSFVPRPLLLFFFDIHTYYRPEVCSVCRERRRGHKCIQEGRLFFILLLPISLKERKTPTLPIFSQFFFFPIFFPRKERKTKKKDKKERQKENPRKRKERDKNPKSESSVLFCVYF